MLELLANGTLDRMTQTREAMNVLGSRCRAADPETIVVFTPHGLAIPGFVSVFGPVQMPPSFAIQSVPLLSYRRSCTSTCGLPPVNAGRSQFVPPSTVRA